MTQLSALRRGLLLSAALLLLLCAASLAVGAKEIPLGQVWHGLAHPTGTEDDVIVRSLRLPRTLVAVAAGAALGLSGTLMQALTRNPLADPGLLGVSTGASAAVVSAIAFLGVGSTGGYLWFALAGAGVATVLVCALGGLGGSSPVRLALAGTAVSAALVGYITGVELLHQQAFDQLRMWSVGSLSGSSAAALLACLPFLLVGLALCAAVARPLNALALGEDAARAVGVRVGGTRALGILAVTLLCGAATALCGPVSFIGLMIPHAVRARTGPDLRRILPYALLLSPSLLLAADIAGRLLGSPGEVPAGVTTAVIGAPVFIALVRGRGRGRVGAGDRARRAPAAVRP
ncbi:FecCD family ABC transporter permease [Streptacidiphilus cavernicola]|uniref:FecCD family ABC transporter permease n=1 Tax=Streptacidiphilus cavernicola TaxID=3342716 RepID=A0ABV6W4K9_9ACTN